MCNAVPEGCTRPYVNHRARQPPNWWVYSSHAMHPDVWSHSDSDMTLGKGAM